MTKTKLTFFLLSLAMLMACTTRPTEQKAEVDVYFNLSQLLNHQIENLTAVNAKLEKQLTSGEAKETITITPDSLGWTRQLRLFYEADINKIGFRDEYFEEELPAIDGTSRKIYSVKNQKHPVQVMECIYDGNQLKEVRLLVKETNTIYNATKEMSLYFDKQTNLVSFNILGGEAMALKKNLSYSIQGKIVYESKPE